MEAEFASKASLESSWRDLSGLHPASFCFFFNRKFQQMFFFEILKKVATIAKTNINMLHVYLDVRPDFADFDANLSLNSEVGR